MTPPTMAQEEEQDDPAMMDTDEQGQGQGHRQALEELDALQEVRDRLMDGDRRTDRTLSSFRFPL